MVKYYLEVGYEEHMLYANEIAVRYGLVEDEKPLSAKVTSILKKYAKKNNIEIPRLFYHTQYGLKRVYMQALYKPAMEEYVKLGG
jgi:hypothetical protein